MDNRRVLQEREAAVKEYSLRNANKQVMEKKRRARINTCLIQLKLLVLQGLKKDTSQYTKLEKADILEMTVKYLKSLNAANAMSSSKSAGVRTTPQYQDGFQECANEVQCYLKGSPAVQQAVRVKLLDFLADSVSRMDTNDVNGQKYECNKENLPNRVSLADRKDNLYTAVKSRPIRTVLSERNAIASNGLRQKAKKRYCSKDNTVTDNVQSIRCESIPARPVVSPLSCLPQSLHPEHVMPPRNQLGTTLNNDIPPQQSLFKRDHRDNFCDTYNGRVGNELESGYKIAEVFPSHLRAEKSEPVWRPW